MQVRTEKTRVPKCKVRSFRKNTKDERNQKITTRVISSVYMYDSGVTVSVCEQLARKVACESSAVKYGAESVCSSFHVVQ